jgi:hypothetical protein
VEARLLTIVTLLTPEDCRCLKRLVNLKQYFVEEAESVRLLRERLTSSSDLPIIFCDEANDWKAVLSLCVEKYVPKVVVCSRHARTSTALWSEVLHHGGYDLLTLPFIAEPLNRVLKMASIPMVRGAH